MIDTITIKTDISEELFYTLKELKFGTYFYFDKNNKEKHIPSLLDVLRAKERAENKENLFLGLQKIIIDDKGSKSENYYVRQHSYSLSITISIANIIKEDFKGEKLDILTILSAKEIKKHLKLIPEYIADKIKSYCFHFFFTEKANIINNALKYEYGDTTANGDIFLQTDTIHKLQDLTRYRIDRVDYCCSIRTVDAAEYIKFLKAGDKPNQGRGTFKDNKKDGSLYLIRESYNINFYSKQHQLINKHNDYKKKHPKYKDYLITDKVLAETKNIVRIEIQYHRDKVRNKINTKSFLGELEEVFSNDNLEQAKADILDVYDKVAHKGNYYKREELRAIINQKVKSEPTRKKMFELIDLVNTHPKKRPIRKVRELLKEGKLNSTLFKTQKDITSLIKDKFDGNNINVVCLEDSYERKCLLNLRRDIVRELYK